MGGIDLSGVDWGKIVNLFYNPLWTRYTEVVIGRSMNIDFEGYGPYNTIPANDAIDRKRKYFAMQDDSIANGVTFRSVIKGSDGVYKRNVDIDFDIKSKSGSGTSVTDFDVAEVVLHNVDESLDVLFDKSPMIIKSGYVGFYDTIFAGSIYNIETVHEESGYSLNLKVVSNYKAFLGKIPYSMEYPIGTKYNKIVEELLEMAPIPIGYIHSTNELTKEKFVISADKTIMSQIIRLADKLDYQYSFSGNKFYFVPNWITVVEYDQWTSEELTRTASAGLPASLFDLNMWNGLINVDKQISNFRGLLQDPEVKYHVTALLLPYYTSRSILRIDSKRFGELQLKVNEVEFRSDSETHFASMKCENLESLPEKYI